MLTEMVVKIKQTRVHSKINLKLRDALLLHVNGNGS